MQHNKQAFTLIELLVVMLIIGILSAVAVPQYQKVIDKTHIASYLNIATEIRNAQELFFLANGEYAKTFSELEIDSNWTQYCKYNNGNTLYNCQYGIVLDNVSQGEQKRLSLYWCPGEANPNYSDCSYYKNEAAINFFYGHHPTNPNEITCDFKTTRGKHICSQF